jgi:phage host-nuclease inhibitor protein Gam
MSKTRIKLQQGAISRDRAESLVAEIADLTVKRNTLSLVLDAEITALRDKYGPDIAALQKGIDDRAALVESWAAANADDFPRGRKSVDFPCGTVGYRTGTPKLKTLARKTWDAILDTLTSLGLTAWVRVKTEVDKSAILAAHAAGEATDDDLRRIGLQVAQDESFFIEPKIEAVENRVSREVAA